MLVEYTMAFPRLGLRKIIFNKDTLYFSIEIPDSVTKIANDGFRSNYTSDKQKNGAVTTNDKLGDYKVVSIDFTNATELTTIEYQAAKYEPLQGVLDLSNTKITKIEKKRLWRLYWIDRRDLT